MSAVDRSDNIPRNRVCRSCLGPRELCFAGKLCSSKNIPSKLICPGCIRYANMKGISPHNVLFCILPRADHPKPLLSDLIDVLNKYCGPLSPGISKDNLVIAAHACHQAMTVSSCKCGQAGKCNCKIETKTKDRVGPNPAPAIHTQTGKVVKIDKSQIVTESREAPFYIMQ